MPKRVVFLLGFLFLFSNSFAGSHHHFHAGVSFMPALMLDEHFHYDTFKISYAPGLQMYYGGKKLFFNTGIHYLHLVEGSNFTKHDHVRDVTYAYGIDSTIYKTRSSSRYHMLGFPLMCSLVLGESKIKFILEAGLQINYLIARGGKTITQFKDGSERTYTYLQPTEPRDAGVYLAPTLRVGIQQSIAKDFLIMAMPEIGLHTSEYWVVGVQFIALKSFH